MQKHHSFIVIGGGFAGIEAALRAAERGMETVLIEPGFLGGTCLNSGCIPTKYLLSGSAASIVKSEDHQNFLSGAAQIDFAALQKQKQAYIAACRTNLERQLLDAGITLIKGKALFTGPNSVRVKIPDELLDLTFSKAAIAVGSTPVGFPNVKADGAAVMGSSTALNLKEAPKSLIILGAGPIGLELGEFFHRMGTHITLVEKTDRILCREDPQISSLLGEYLVQQGWDLQLGRGVAGFSTDAGEALLTFEDGSALRAEKGLVAIGRTPATAGLGVEHAGIDLMPRQAIKIDSTLRATPDIYALGDVNALCMVANSAIDQARYAVAHLTGQVQCDYCPPNVPLAIYGSMEIMRVGIPVADLVQSNKKITTTTALLSNNHIAQGAGLPQGFVKAYWIDNILASIAAIGYNVSYLVGLSAMLVRDCYRYGSPLNAMFAMPTLDLSIEEALLAKQEPFI